MIWVMLRWLRRFRKVSLTFKTRLLPAFAQQAKAPQQGRTLGTQAPRDISPVFASFV